MMKNFFKNSKIIKAFYGIFGTLPLLLTLYLYPFIPDKIPTHYWLDGSIDKWGNKGELFVVPVIILIFVLCQPKIFRINFNYKPEDNITKWHNVYFLLILNMLSYCTLYISLNYESCLSKFNFYNFFTCTLCFIFAFVGTYIQHCNRSSSFSIRTRFTLENEVIWQKTHKFCGILWVSGSVVMFPMFLFSSGLFLGTLALLMMLIFILSPVAYTHYLHNKFIKGKLNDYTNKKLIQHPRQKNVF